MNKYLKRTTLLIVALLTFVLAFTGCAKESTTTTTSSTSGETTEDAVEPTATEAEQAEEGLTAGVFEYSMTPEGRDPMYNFLKFYDNGVFYASMYDGGQYNAGFYEVLDEEMEYLDKSEETQVATQTIILNNVDGSEYSKVAYDAEQGIVGEFKPLYDNEFVQNLEPEGNIEETGVSLYEYILEDDEYSMVAIKHNGTFEDTIGMLIEGTWEFDGTEYTMTDTDSDSVYSLTLNEDGETAKYVGPDGTEITLNLVKNSEIILTFTGAAVSETMGDVEARIECLDDESAKLIIVIGTNEQEQAGHSWKLAEDKSSVSLVIDDQEYSAPINMDDHSFAFDYTMDINGEELTFPMSTSDSKPEAATVKYVFAGENNEAVRLDCYSDGKCELFYEGMGVVTSGTWSIDTSAGPLPTWTIELEETYESQGINVETDYSTKFFFTFKNAGGQLEEVLVLSFADYQASAE